MSYYVPVPQVRVDGSPQGFVAVDKRTVVGPASYAADGIPVDLSSVFTSLLAVRVLRAYVTATKAIDTRRYEVNEIATDTLANRKFRLKVFDAKATATDAHVLKATGSVTNDSDVLTATGAAANVAATETGAAASCGAVGCSGTHPNTVVAQRANVVQASGAGKASAVIKGSGASKVTAVTAVADEEITATTNLSTITIEYEAIGVPA